MTTDGGQVQVKFTVANAEVVRQALHDLGAQGEKALKQFDASAQPLNGSMKILSQVMAEVKGKAHDLAGAGGVVSSILMGWGPAGIAAAAGVGIIVAAFTALVAAAAEVGAKAQALQAFSMATGLTTDEIQRLDAAAANYGITTDSVTTSIDRFAVNLDGARKATGPYYDMIREINPELAEQVLTTKGVSAQLLILAQAYAQAGEKGQALLKNAFGRGGVALAPLVSAIGASGDVGNIGPPPGLTPDEVKSMAATTAELNASWERIKTNIGAIAFTPESAANALELRHDIEAITAALRDFSPTQAWVTFTNWVDGKSGGWLHRALNSPAPMTPNLIPSPEYPPKLNMTGLESPTPAETPEQIANKYKAYVAALGPAATIQEQFNVKVGELNVALETGALNWDGYNRAFHTLDLQKNVQVMQSWTSVLGKSLTLTEQAAVFTAELAEKQDKAKFSDDVRKRALEAFNLTQGAAIAAMRERYGVESEEALLVQKLGELEQQRKDGFIKNDAEMAAAEAVVRKEVRDTIDAMSVRTSPTPALKQLQIDGANLSKTLDQELASGLRSLTADLISMAKGTETTSQGLQNMGLKMLEAVANALLLKAAIGPIAGLLSGGLGSIFGPGASVKTSAHGNVFSGPGISAYSNSIVDRPTFFRFASGAGIMGEAGTEGIFPLRRDARGDLGVSGVGASVVNNTVIENHTGGQVSESKVRNNSGGFDHRIIIGDTVSDDIASGGPISRVIERQYGLTRTAGAFG